MTDRRRGTPRIPPTVGASQPAPPALLHGKKGDKGDRGEKGDSGHSFFLGVAESSSGELLGSYAPGFIRSQGGLQFLECAFSAWEPGDVLSIDFWLQLLSQTRRGPVLCEAQVSLDLGTTFHGLARTQASAAINSASASGSVVLPSAPLVRLFVTQYDGPVDFGPGPEGSTALLRAFRWKAGTFDARGQLRPPLR